MDFDFTIIYKPGSTIGDADGLSRQAWPQQVQAAATGEDTREISRRGGGGGGGEMWGQTPQSWKRMQ